MDGEDDDIYGTGEAQDITTEPKTEPVEAMDEDDEEESEEESDSDVEIITEKERPEPTEPLKPSRNPLPIVRPDSTTPSHNLKRTASPAIKPPSKSSTPQPSTKPGTSYPALKTSTLDLDAKPTHPGSGKPITEVDIDADLAEDDKPWRIPGSDQTDYFNYGFDEFTWTAYCLKQSETRAENKEAKKAMGDLGNMFPGAAGLGSGPAGAPAGMMGMMDGGMPPEMQAMMQQMMASGMDPGQMDMGSFMGMMGGNAGQGGGGFPGQGAGMGGFDQGQGNMGGGFGGQQQQQQPQAPSAPQGHGGGRGRRGRGRW